MKMVVAGMKTAIGASAANAHFVRIRDLGVERSECLLPDLSSSKHTLP
jgi:hypothetical protein